MTTTTIADDLATLLHYGHIAAGVVVRRRNEVKDAHDRVKAEIARLEGSQHHLTAEWRDKALAAEAEAARLKQQPNAPLEYPYCQVLPNGKGAVVLLWKEQIEWLTRELGGYSWGGIATQINSELHMALSRIAEHERESGGVAR